MFSMDFLMKAKIGDIFRTTLTNAFNSIMEIRSDYV